MQGCLDLTLVRLLYMPLAARAWGAPLAGIAGLESRWEQGYVCLVSVVCSLAEVFATG
jgi:hypothetical protein